MRNNRGFTLIEVLIATSNKDAGWNGVLFRPACKDVGKEAGGALLFLGSG